CDLAHAAPLTPRVGAVSGWEHGPAQNRYPASARPGRGMYRISSLGRRRFRIVHAGPTSLTGFPGPHHTAVHCNQKLQTPWWVELGEFPDLRPATHAGDLRFTSPSHT